MVGRWFFLAVVGIGLAVIVHGQRSNASTGKVTLACAAASGTDIAVTATVDWQRPASLTDQEWFDLSVTRDFVDGTWAGTGPLSPGAASFTTDALASGLHYYYRVNTLHGGEWSTTASGSFVAECPAATSAG